MLPCQYMLQQQIHIERLAYVDDPMLDYLEHKAIKYKPLYPRQLKQYPSFAEFYISYDVSKIRLNTRYIMTILVFTLAANMPADFLTSYIQAIFILDRNNFGIIDYFQYLFYNYLSALIGATLSIYANRVRNINHSYVCIANLCVMMVVALACLLNIYSDVVVAYILFSLGFFKYNLQISSSALICKVTPLAVQHIVFHFGYVFYIVTYFLSDICYISYDLHIVPAYHNIAGQKLYAMFKQLMEYSLSNCALAIVICTFCYVYIGYFTTTQRKVLQMRSRAKMHYFVCNFSHSNEYWVLCFIFATMYVANVDYAYINSSTNIKFYFLKPVHFIMVYHGFSLLSAVVSPFIVYKLGHRPLLLLVTNIVAMGALLLMHIEPTYVKAICFAIMGFCASLINPLTKQIFGAFSNANNVDFAYFISLLIYTAMCIAIPIIFNGNREGAVTLFFGDIRVVGGTSIICSGLAMLFSLFLNIINVRRFHGLLNDLK